MISKILSFGWVFEEMIFSLNHQLVNKSSIIKLTELMNDANSHSVIVYFFAIFMFSLFLIVFPSTSIFIIIFFRFFCCCCLPSILNRKFGVFIYLILAALIILNAQIHSKKKLYIGHYKEDASCAMVAACRRIMLNTFVNYAILDIIRLPVCSPALANFVFFKTVARKRKIFQIDLNDRILRNSSKFFIITFRV